MYPNIHHYSSFPAANTLLKRRIFFSVAGLCFNLFYALGIHPCVLRALTCGTISIPKYFLKMYHETKS